MSDNVPSSTTKSHTFPQPEDAESSRSASPPLTDLNETTDEKMSRKRAREISIEPSTPRPFNDDDDDTSAPPKPPKDRPQSPKKTRTGTKLESTVEEEYVIVQRPSTPEPQSSLKPPPTASVPFSPRLEVKMRQISQGVGDIDMQKAVETVGVPNASELDLPLRNAGEDGTNLASFLDKEKDEDIHSGLDADKGLKRKLGDRAVSTDPIDTVKPVEAPDHPKRTRETAPTPEIIPNVASPAFSETMKQKRKPAGFLAYASTQSPFLPINETTKRPRENAEKDSNPRMTKRPTPPPADEAVSNPKKGGFMAYASETSPFASVKGENVFRKSPSPLPSPLIKATVNIASLHPPATISSASRTGFDSFAGSMSPFASFARGKSPMLSGNNTNAFSAYALGGAQGFSLASSSVPALAPKASKKPKDGSEGSSGNDASDEEAECGDIHSQQAEKNGSVSFGDKLRAQGEEGAIEEEKKIELIEQESNTGEEEEETMHQVRGKLFKLSESNQWQERGTGTLKLNVRQSDGAGARLVMRKEAVYSLLLNVTLFHGMACSIAQDPRYVRFSVLESGVPKHYNLRVANQKIAEELLEAIKFNLPSKEESDSFV